jgi:hypothetical protein
MFLSYSVVSLFVICTHQTFETKPTPFCNWQTVFPIFGLSVLAGRTRRKLHGAWIRSRRPWPEVTLSYQVRPGEFLDTYCWRTHAQHSDCYQGIKRPKRAANCHPVCTATVNTNHCMRLRTPCFHPVVHRMSLFIGHNSHLCSRNLALIRLRHRFSCLGFMWNSSGPQD